MTTIQCTCQAFSFGTYGADGSAESFEDYTTECTQTTTRVFAQGHDAKLVGFLVRAELAGEEISRIDGGVKHTFAGAVQAAGTVSEALAAKAQAQLDAARARNAKKAAREAAKAARKSAKAVEPVEPASRLANIKIGRWTYTARIDMGAAQYGLATYSDKQGNKKTVTSDKYTEV